MRFGRVYRAVQRAVEDFLQREGSGITRYVDELCEHSPFKEEK